MKKHILTFLAILCSFVFFVACNDEEQNIDNTPFLIVTRMVVVPADSTTSVFAIASSDSQVWSIASSDTWCKAEPTSGTGDAMITVTLKDNFVAIGRPATLTVTHGSEKVEVLVTQFGAAPVISLSASSFSVSDAAGSDTVIVTSNGPWSAAVDSTAAEWCTLNRPGSTVPAVTIDTLIISYTSNPTKFERAATITVSAGTLTKTIALTQTVGDVVLQVSPSILNFTQAAGSLPINVSVAGTWTAVVVGPDPSTWCTLDNASGGGKGIVTVNVSELTADAQRVDTVIVTSDDMVQKVLVIQAYYFTDTRDNKSYKMVKLPDGKWWMAQNLNYTKDMTYNSGSNLAYGVVMPAMTAPTGAYPFGASYMSIGSYWANGNASSTVTNSPATYTNGEEICATYGAIYAWETAIMLDGKWSDNTHTSSAWDENWVIPNRVPTASASSVCTVNNARGTNNQGICPPGWHLPTDAEWSTMFDATDGDGTGTGYMTQTGATGDNLLTGSVDVGKKLKTTGMCETNGVYCNTDTDPKWNYHATAFGTDVYGFGAIPSGYRNNTTFLTRGLKVFYWTSSVSSGTGFFGYSRVLTAISAKAGRSSTPYRYGAAVRCVKNN